jgi:uncharacterized secreted protein with C-terminal beta-propeller domain
MKKIILYLILFLSFINADSILLLKKGWQLVGLSIPLNDMSKFESKNVEQVWHFDSNTQKWLGYSPDNIISDRMKKKNIQKLEKLENWHGFWVKSKRDWALILDSNQQEDKAINQDNPKDIIQLKKGWNLISLPIDTIVSPHIFDNMTVWKYDTDNKWELFDDINTTKEEFPPIKYISNADALWVKVNKDKNISISQESSRLHNFNSKKEMYNFIKEMIIANHSKGCIGIEPFSLLPLYTTYSREVVLLDSNNPPVPSPINTTSTTPQAEDATRTNTQESNVDESDILKHNGEYIFYVVSQKPSYINITSFQRLVSEDNNSKILAKIPIDKNLSIDSIYLLNNKLIALSKELNHNKVIVDIYDISDINNIDKITRYKIDGTMKTSRLIEDNLYLITNFNPNVTISYPKQYIKLSKTCKEFFHNLEEGDYYQDEKKYAECFNIIKDDNGKYFRYDYDNPIVDIHQLAPKIQENNQNPKDLLIASNFYASSKQDQIATITTISKFSISDNKYKNNNSFIGSTNTQYASTKAFYLVSNQYPIYYDFSNYQERSKIYKFSLDNGIKYKGGGYVYGHILNQFALSEYNNILRVATTTRFTWRNQNSKNSIYTLKEENQKLKIIGSLSGLGKVGENIKSVRFIKDKAFVVTFKQTDPFYTIDISNPASIKKMGELQVHGYSAYLHPIEDNKILGIGRDATENGAVKGLKIELFDISDFANPQSLDTIILPYGTYSELEYNHKAFIYRESDKLFAFPYSLNSRMQYKLNRYLGIYQVVDNSLKKYTPINSDNSSYGRYSNHRGLIFDMNNKTYVTLFSNSDFILTKELNKTK